MNDFIKIEENTLKNWAEKELGQDNFKQIRENPYINGEAKRVLDYIFENFLDPDFSKIIDLNLALDENTDSDLLKTSLDKENFEFVGLKIRYLELKEELCDLEKRNTEEEQDINLIVKNLSENQSSSSTNDNFSFLKKNMEMMLIEDEFERKKMQQTKIDEASNRLNLLLDKKSVESAEKDCFLNAFKIQRSKDNDKDEEKFNLLALEDYFELLNSKTQEEIVKLNHILDGQALKNEVDLLKYQNTNEFSLSNVLSLDDAINQELLNMIVLSSQSFQHQANKIKNDQNYEILLKSLKKNRINKYYREYLGLYGRYFKSFITLKKISCEFNQLNTIFEQLKSEKDFYRNSFLAITKRFDRIKSMELKINKKQIEIEDAVNDNVNYFNQKLQLDLDKIGISWDQLADIFRIFISSNLVMNSSKNDSNCPNDSRQIKIELYKQHLYHCFNNEPKKQDDFEMRLHLIEELFNLRKEGKSNSFLMSIFSGKVLEISKRIKTITNKKEHQISINEIENSFGDLDSMLANCKSIDKRQIVKFSEIFEEKIESCEQNHNLINELANLVSKWFNQPAVHDCPLESYTVNSKSLDYYTEYISELIKEKHYKV